MEGGEGAGPAGPAAGTARVTRSGLVSRPHWRRRTSLVNATAAFGSGDEATDDDDYVVTKDAKGESGGAGGAGKTKGKRKRVAPSKLVCIFCDGGGKGVSPLPDDGGGGGSEGEEGTRGRGGGH